MPKIKFGKKRVIWGNTATMKRTIKIGGKNLKVALVTLSIGTLATLLKTNRTVPKGGVMTPITRLRIIIIPKWTGSIPICLIKGRKTGTRMFIAATVSMKQPTKSNTIFIKKRSM